MDTCLIWQVLWSQADAHEVPEALAAFTARPASVPAFKLTKNGGYSELCRGVGGPNVKKFFEGWCSFIKMAHVHEAKFTHLSNVPARPMTLYVNDSELEVMKVEMGVPTTFVSIRVVAAVGANASAFDVMRMETRMFQQTGQKLGAAIMLS